MKCPQCQVELKQVAGLKRPYTRHPYGLKKVCKRMTPLIGPMVSAQKV